MIAPHPDDEAIAAWALIRRCIAQGGTVDVLVISDGGASHPQSHAWPRTRLVAERQRETRREMRKLGVTPDHIEFLGLADGALNTPQMRLPARLRRAVLRRLAPDLIVAPMLGDAHADHHAVAQALLQVPRRGEQRAGYRVWPEGAARKHAQLAIPLSNREIGMKRASLRRYRTQAGLIKDAVPGFAMTHRHLVAFSRPTEDFALT